MRVLPSLIVPWGVRNAGRGLLRSQARFCWSEADGMSERGVFVIDSSASFVDLARGQEQTITAKIKHPSSNHTAASYASYVHKFGSYNFNTVDDFSLSIAAAQILPAEPAAPPTAEPQKHSLILWPDNLIITGLERTDISIIGKYILGRSMVSAESLLTHLGKGARVEPLSGLHVVLPVSTTYTVNNVLRAMEWFQTAFKNNNVEQPVSYHISSEIRRPHSIPTQALLLPSGLQYTNVHSQKRVDQIMQEVLRHSDVR